MYFWDICFIEAIFVGIVMFGLGFLKAPRFLMKRKLVKGFPWGYYADQVPQGDPISSRATVTTSSTTPEPVSVGLRASAITANLVVLASSASMVVPLLVETAAVAAAAVIEVIEVAC